MFYNQIPMHKFYEALSAPDTRITDCDVSDLRKLGHTTVSFTFTLNENYIVAFLVGTDGAAFTEDTIKESVPENVLTMLISHMNEKLGDIRINCIKDLSGVLLCRISYGFMDGQPAFAWEDLWD